jgi:hypothetical protein
MHASVPIRYKVPSLPPFIPTTKCMKHDFNAAAEIIGAGCSMFTHHNSVYVFGGMDDERTEHMSMWKWDLTKDEGFEPVSYRCDAFHKLPALPVHAKSIRHQ